MTDMRTGLVIAFLGAWLGACGDARALSCGESVRVENHTGGQVTVVIKSFYGVGFEQPDPGDFSPETGRPPGAKPFIYLYEIPLGPGASNDVFVRTLCNTPGRRHWVNWSYSIDGAASVSGQEDLTRTIPRIIVESSGRKTSG